MTEDDARRIATQAIDTWPNGPKGYVWQNEVRNLDADMTRQAMTKLRRETDRATTAQFHAVYAALRNATAVAHVPASCGLCNGTGWIEATTAEAHNPQACNGTPAGGGCTCHGVKPCRCTNASQAHRVVALIHGTENP